MELSRICKQITTRRKSLVTGKVVSGHTLTSDTNKMSARKGELQCDMDPISIRADDIDRAYHRPRTAPAVVKLIICRSFILYYTR